MILERIEVEGLKGFAKATMNGLEPVNIIVGPNGSGKTTLLEAIFMGIATGAPNSLIDLNRKRNVTWGGGNPEEFSEGQVGNWFHEKNRKGEVKITTWSRSIKRGEPKKAVTRIRREEEEEERTFLSEVGDQRRSVRRARRRKQSTFGEESREGTPDAMGQVPVGFTYEEYGRGVVEWSVFVGEDKGKIRRQGRIKNEVEGTIIHTDKTMSPDVTSYARAIRNGTFGPVLAAVRKVAPEVQEVYVSVAGRQAGLWARTSMGKSIPFGEVGGGAAAIAEIVHRVEETTYGIILVDEIENGIYFESHEGLWRAIFEAIQRKRDRDYEIQFVATTHSRECYQAALRANEGREVAIFRTEREEEGETGIERIEGVEALRAAREAAELR